MATSVQARPILGDSVKESRWYLDVRPVGTSGDTGWIPVGGLTEIKNGLETNEEDVSDQGQLGWDYQQTTSRSHSIEGKVRRALTNTVPPEYDAGQNLIEAAAENTEDNRLEARIYEMGAVRQAAYKGIYLAKWENDGGAMNDLSTISFALAGLGPREKITHPAPISGGSSS